MAGNDIFAHVIALHGLVDGVSVVDEEGDPLPVPAVGADADVVPVAEDHNVPGLPLGGINRWDVQFEADIARRQSEKESE